MLYIQQSPLLRIARGALAASVLVLPAWSGPAASQTPSAPCYELIPARARIDPPAPMLVDKCSGRTWLLTRIGRGGYRWTAIDTESESAKAVDRPATDSQPARKDGGGEKCFTFNNRKFCE